jgi:hypothetical protein
MNTSSLPATGGDEGWGGPSCALTGDSGGSWGRVSLGPPQGSSPGVRPRGRSPTSRSGQTAYTDPVPEASLVYGLRGALAAFRGFPSPSRCLASRILPPYPCCYQWAQRREPWSLARDRNPRTRGKRQDRLEPGGMDADRAGISHVLLRFPQPQPVQDPCGRATGTSNTGMWSRPRPAVRGRTAPVPLGAVPIRCQPARLWNARGNFRLARLALARLPARSIRAGPTGPPSP